MSAWLFDGALAAGLLWLGWRVVATPDPFKSTLLFIALGLLMALCWARLAAPDVALAEAAIGAGLTGALLLDACRALPDRAPREGESPDREWWSPVLVVLCGALTLALAGALVVMPEPAVDLGTQVRARLAESGVSNPVTAVLLNFRSYDTLLEVAVLMLALIGVCTVGADQAHAPALDAPTQDSPLLDALIRVLLPVASLVAAYLLWAGAHAPGGAFQGGAVLAGVGVMLRLGGWLHGVSPAPAPWRVLPVLGLAVFVAAALGVMVWTGNLLQYPLPWAGAIILVIETALTVSIGVTLALLFIGAPALGTR